MKTQEFKEKLEKYPPESRVMVLDIFEKKCMDIADIYYLEDTNVVLLRHEVLKNE